MKESTFARVLNPVLAVMDRVLAVFLTILVGLMASGVMVSVFLRYVFNIAFAWSEELLTVVFIATSFFGAALGIREKEHISINFFEKSSLKLKKMINTIAMAAVIAVAIVVFIKSLEWIQRVGGVPSPATGIPSGTFYLFVPISFAITIFYSLADILGYFIPLRGPATKSEYVEYSAVQNQIGGGTP
jgi:TRAP-type C4-dicarboxylate transport system permease small subunit